MSDQPVPQPTASKKVAIVHDWLYGGGAERVVYELHRMYPEAPIYTSYCSDEWRQKLDGKVVTGYLQKWPFSKLRKFLPVLRIWWFENLNLNGYDLVISSSGNGEAKGVRAGTKFVESQQHICYCHSPTHFYWRHYQQYLHQPGFGVFDGLARLGLKLLVGPLRRWDYRAAQRPDMMIANSTHIQNDIQTYYGRPSTIVFPPVDVDRFAAIDSSVRRQGFVVVGRQVPFKRFDIVIQACNQLQLALTVVGRGPEHQNLKKLAGPTITFDDQASDEQVVRYMQSAEAFIFSSYEDFGITPVEAMAAGTPVIAYKAGGALDFVQPSVTGEFFDAQTAESLTAILQKFQAASYDHEVIRQAAQRFSSRTFQQQIAGAIAKTSV